MKLFDALIHAARFSTAPTFTVFRMEHDQSMYNAFNITAQTVFGRNSVEVAEMAEKTVEAFKAEALKDETMELEVRCDGIRVEFNGT